MKRAEYKLPFGVHEALEPVEVGRTEGKKDKQGNVILNEKDNKPGNPIYEYKTIGTKEPETMVEFLAEMVEQDKPEEHTQSLAQAQYDIIVQRKIREFFQSEDCAQMLAGKHADTKDLSEDERVEYVMQAGQEVADNYRYGARAAGTGGLNAAGKKALDKAKAIDAAAAANPELAAKKAELEAMLASLGITV